MIVLLKIAATVPYDFGNEIDGPDIRLIPDLNLAPGVVWSSSLTDQDIVRIHIERPGRISTLMFLDFGLLGPAAGVQHYVAEANRKELQMLKNRLGDENVTILIRAMRNRRPVRLRAAELGWRRKLRTSNGDVIGIRIPLVTCGGGDGSDLDIDRAAGETEETLPVLADL